MADMKNPNMNPNPGQREPVQGQEYATGKSSPQVPTQGPRTGSHEPTPDVLTNIQDRAQQLGAAVATTAEQAWDKTRNRVRDVASEIVPTAEQAWESMVACMSRYPLAVFFTGIGLGFVLSQMLTRRD